MNIKELIEKKNSKALDQKDFEFFTKYLIGKKYSEKYVLEFLNTFENKGCTDTELYHFALAMAKSGKMLNLSEKFDCCVDKYSFGKYSDGMSLILMSVLASVGIKFARVMSDKGQYGTKLSRLRAIEGFTIPKDLDESVRNANTCGAFFVNYMGNIAPVTTTLYDICKKHNKFYELSYIAMIMANKIAVGANVLLGDIKVGEGAAATDEERLAKRLVSIGKLANIKTIAVVTDLNCPVSASVGVMCELHEVIDILSGAKDHNASRLFALAKEMVVCVLMATKYASSRTKAMAIFDDSISSGKAYKRFCQIIESYGGNMSSLGRASRLIDIAVSYITAPNAGYISNIKLDQIYSCANKIISDGKNYDNGAGVVLMCDEGDKVVEGQKIAKIYYSFKNKRYFDTVKQLQDSFEISKEKKKTNKLLYKVVV